MTMSHEGRAGITEPTPRIAGKPAAPSPSVSRAVVVGIGAIALVELALLVAWQRNGFWDFSDGVYALSARELLHGLTPYRDFAAAQPPPVYLFGALVLAIHDGVTWLRVSLGLVDLVTSALAGVCVWRLTGRRWLVATVVVITPLIPISLHEHAQLTPETLAAPLMLAGALLGARKGGGTAAGALLALAAACKFAFVIPALAVALVCAERRRATVALVIGGAILAGISLAVFGGGVWRDAVQAQLQVGRPPLHYSGGLLAQAAWTEFALVIGAVAAVWLAYRGEPSVTDRELVRTLAAAALGGLALALTVFKRGSYINVLVVAEPPLLVLTVCGALWSVERWRASRPVVALLGALLALQSISLLTSPGDPWAAKRPGARSGLAWSAGPAEINREVAAARRCPLGEAYSGGPYVAFLAGRRMPGYQPDVFILANAPAVASFAARAARDQPRCPKG
jgi:hypothetical protein